MKKTIISLHGSYFYNNYGDILLIRLFISWIQEEFPNVLINLPLANKNKDNDLPKGCLRGIKNLVHSKCLVYCGGGYFGEQPVHKIRWSLRNFKNHIVIGIIAVVLKIPIGIIGVEFGPLSIAWFRRSVIWLAKHASIVVVRNHESYMFLKNNGVHNVVESVDAVLTLPQAAPMGNTSKIALHIPNMKYAPVFYEQFIKILVSELKKRKINEVTFIEDSNHQYNESYEFLFSIFSQANILYSLCTYQGANYLIEKLKEYDYIITTKLHVGITGIALGKKVLAVYSHPKVLRFHKQVYNQSLCVPVNSNEMAIRNCIDTFFNVPYELPNSIRSKARLNKKHTIDFLRKVLSQNSGIVNDV